MSLREFDHLDPSERDYWIADWQLSRLTCGDCGNPVDECSDPKRVWYPYRRICYASMERAAAEAAVSDLRGEHAQYHDGTFTDWTAKRDEGHPYPAGAGETIGVADRDLAPWDEFTTELDASPDASVAEESPGEQSEPTDEPTEGYQPDRD